MTTYKRIDGDYHIQTVNAWDHVFIDTSNVYISGNLQVSGNVTYIDVTELNVTDPFVVLNASNTATYASNSGILTHKTASDYAGIRYNDDAGQWELSTSTSSSGTTGSWTVISTGAMSSPGGANTNIQFNDNGTFGGNANFAFDYATSRLFLDGTLVLDYTTSTPPAVANAATVTSSAPNSGGTGIYFNNGSNQDELISKSKAIVFSIIF